MSKRPASSKTTANPMWGGQFGTGAADVMAAINVSIHFDKALAAQDIAGSLAHAAMLKKQGVLNAKEHQAIEKGLKAIEKEIASGTFHFKESLEDIHMNVEARLAELIGAPAGKLHTARSRNDQVATDFRLWVRDALDALDRTLQALQKTLLARAEEYADAVMPGFTHLQPAQPITLGHHLLAYVEMIGRDRSRVKDARDRMNELPLGAGALAGTSFPIDRDFVAKTLGFARPMANSLDAVSDRDFALEFLSIASITAMHLSRLAEEFVLWTTPMFGFIRLSDKFSTGSSMMPQKRNPDGAELVRGKAGRIIGQLNALLITLKALPLTYNKDMQEDKEPVFEACEQLGLAVAATTGMVGDFTADRARMESLAGEGYSTATDLADWVVRSLDIPFRQSHHIAARIVKLAAQKKKALHELALKDLQSVEPRITKDAFSVLKARDSVNSRKSFGGTSPVRVKEAIKAARKKYL